MAGVLSHLTIGEGTTAEGVGGARVTPFMFPTAVMILVFGSWVVLASFDSCMLERADPKFDCWSSIQLAAAFSAIGSFLTGLMALLARVLLHPFLAGATRRRELISALVSSIVLILVSASIIRWEMAVGHIGHQLFGWLGISFIVCGLSLLLVKL